MKRERNSKIILPVLIIVFGLFNTLPSPVLAESGIYDRIGIIPEHGLHGAVPEENIDLFTGNMTLKFLDIHLPGPNGFDLEIWRVYNSKTVSDHFTHITPGYIQEPNSWVGLGWSLHMGRLHHASSNAPTIEFPDGRQETAHYNLDLNAYITRNFLKLKWEDGDWHLHLKNGTVWTFGHSAVISYGATSDTVFMVTKIKNSFGHEINVVYTTAKPIIEKITDSMGREVLFEVDDPNQSYPKLDKIKIKNANGQWTTFDYTVDPFPCSTYYKLSAFKPPEIPASTYDYYCDASNRYFELQTLNTGLGGTYQYEYEDHIFYFFSNALSTRVIKTKRIKFSPSDSYKTWNYTYPSYQNVSTGGVRQFYDTLFFKALYSQ